MSREKKWPSATRFFVVGALRLFLAVVVIGVSLVVAVKPIGDRADLPCIANGHRIVDVELAATADRSREALVGCDSDDVTSALAWDVPFIALYVAALGLAVWFVGMRSDDGRGAFRLTRLSGFAPTMIGAAVAAGVLDLIEDGALFVGLSGSPPTLQVNDAWAMTAATVSWAKWVLVAVVALYCIAGLFAWVALAPRPSPQAGEARSPDRTPDLAPNDASPASESKPEYARAQV